MPENKLVDAAREFNEPCKFCSGTARCPQCMAAFAEQQIALAVAEER